MIVSTNPNQALLNMLGMGDLRNVMWVTVDLQPGHLPVAKVTQALLQDSWEKTTKQFNLVPLDEYPLPLDIDAMVAAAQERLAAFIELKADEASAWVQYGYHRALGRRPRPPTRSYGSTPIASYVPVPMKGVR